MPKPKIAIDIDDVLVLSAPEILGNYNRRWGTQLILADWYSDIGPQWGTNDDDEAIRRVNEFVESEEYSELPPVQKAIFALQALSRRYELHILTGRHDVIAGATQGWLQRHFPDIFHSVNFSNLFDKTKVRSKGDMCRELGAAYLVDDHLAHCKSAASVGLKAVLFGSYPWNQADELPDGVTRCVDWNAVQEYFDGIG